MKKGIPDNFYELRKIGENESFLCKLIRDDAVKDFIVYVTKNQISLKAKIHLSFYETNPYLIDKCLQYKCDYGVTLIEYAAFYGSDQIFRFLKDEGVELTPSLWYDVIHGNNPELIHLLEDYNIEPTIEEQSFLGCFKESIKCHHNDISNYIINKYLQKEDENSYDIFVQSLEFYNFSFIQNEHINESSFCQLCHYDYYLLIKVLLTYKDVDINSKVIQNHIFK